jgi:hypothetical protein
MSWLGPAIGGAAGALQGMPLAFAPPEAKPVNAPLTRSARTENADWLPGEGHAGAFGCPPEVGRVSRCHGCRTVGVGHSWDTPRQKTAEFDNKEGAWPAEPMLL